VTLSVLVALVLAAQDKYSVKVPNGLAFSEFRGYEDWQVVAPGHTDAEDVMRVIVANPVTMKPYREWLPANGRGLETVSASLAFLIVSRRRLSKKLRTIHSARIRDHSVLPEGARSRNSDLFRLLRKSTLDSKSFSCGLAIAD
jgi:hypothetical protein